MFRKDLVGNGGFINREGGEFVNLKFRHTGEFVRVACR